MLYAWLKAFSTEAALSEHEIPDLRARRVRVATLEAS
jgi:hypothetical protein